MKKINPKYLIIISYVALAIIIIALILALIFDRKKQNNEYEQPIQLNSYLIVSINPKVMLCLNNNTILEIYSLNDDATIFTNDTLKGLNLEEGLDKIISIASENDYIHEDTKIDISTYGNENTESDKKLLSNAEQIIKNHGIDVNIYNLNDEEKEEISSKLNENTQDNTIQNEDNSLDQDTNENNMSNNSTTTNSNNNSQSSNSNKNNNSQSSSNSNNKNNNDNNSQSSSNSNNSTSSKNNDSSQQNNSSPLASSYCTGTGLPKSCNCMMRGTDFQTPSWFKFYSGDRWATSKEYKRVSPSDWIVLIIRKDYNGYDSVSDSMTNGYGTMWKFMQFLPDNPSCLKDLCKEGDMDCYDDVNYKYRNQLQAEKDNAKGYENSINDIKSDIASLERQIAERNDYIKTYCSEVTSETEKCFYIASHGAKVELSDSLADVRAKIAEMQDRVDFYKQLSEDENRILYYQNLRVYQAQKIYDYVKEYFPL